ncbi:MAG: LysR substrate-binding domain-containing protein [Pseudomonadota bacterium]
MTHLSSDLLRTFLAIAETGSVTAGAERIGRSQSATSLQIRQLEGIVGKPVFARHGRGVTLTPAGETLQPVARDVVRSLDAALADLRGGGLKGRLRIGMADDESRSELAGIIADFSAYHPDVELEVHCALGAGFAETLKTGALDLAIFEVPEPEKDDLILREDHLIWMASDMLDTGQESLPIAVFDRDCWWRDLAIRSLDEARQKHRIVFSSESSVGVKAAVEAGIAAGLLSASEEDGSLKRLSSIPTRHRTVLVMRRGSGAEGLALEAMADAVRRAFPG